MQGRYSWVEKRKTEHAGKGGAQRREAAVFFAVNTVSAAIYHLPKLPGNEFRP